MPPGGHDLAQLVLERPTAAAAGDPFVIRDTSAPSRTVGGGRFVDLRAPRAEAPHARTACASLRWPRRICSRRRAAFGGRGAWCDLTTFCRDRAPGANAAEAIAVELGLVTLVQSGTIIAMRSECWSNLRDQIGRSLDACHAERPDFPGVAFEALRGVDEASLPAALFARAAPVDRCRGSCFLDRTWVR